MDPHSHSHSHSHLQVTAVAVAGGGGSSASGTAGTGQATGSAAGAEALISTPLRQLLAAVQEAGLRQWVLPLPGHPRDVLHALSALGAAPDIVSLGGLEGAGWGDGAAGGSSPPLSMYGGREALERWLALLPGGGMLVLAHASTNMSADVSSLAAAAGASVLTLAAHSLVIKGGGAQAGLGSLQAPQQQPQVQGAVAGGTDPSTTRPCDPAAAVPPPGWSPCNMTLIHVDMAGKVVNAAFVNAGPWGNLLSPYYMVRGDHLLVPSSRLVPPYLPLGIYCCTPNLHPRPPTHGRTHAGPGGGPAAGLPL